ncbi:Ig-like domain-containing protein [Candidatus Palauibacter sp.]|uniref:Ig-like domain-containing protein n=1 Tax=Candidatus Palauibacter sp. TaxID=3101350 RepID=UPI003B51A806
MVVFGWVSACGGGSTEPGPTRPPPPPPPPPPANRAPEAIGTVAGQEVVAGTAVRLDLSPYFRDPDGDALTYAAQSGDAAVATVAVAGAELTVTGVAPGSATLTIEARDPGGLSATQTASVTVLAPNQPPVVADTLPAQEVVAGSEVTLELAPYFTDPDGDALTYAAASGDEAVATVAVAGAELTLTGVAPGSATLTIEARDPDGLTAAQTADVTVRAPNQPPAVADTIPAQEVVAGSAVTLDLAPYFTDPDGDALTYAAASGDDAVATVAVAGAELTLTGVAPGSATLTIEARDPDGLTASQTADVTVLAANRPPVVAGTIPAQEVVAGSAVTLDLAPYFTDPDGDALTYAAASGDEAVATVGVAGAELTLTGVAAGSATLTIEARDPDGLTAAQTADVTVLAPNQAPVAAGMLPAQEVVAGSAVTLDLAPYFTDPDGDALTYAAASGDEAVATVAVAGAELTLTGVAAGSASLTIEARDPAGLTASQTADVTVLAANRPPVVAGTIPVPEVAAGSEVTLDLAPYFTDPDGDALTHAAVSSDEAVATVAVAGAELTLTGVAAGSATLTIEARDPDGLTASQTADVTVRAPNQPPVVAGMIPAPEVLAGSAVTLGLAPYFTDPDGDALTYAAVSSDEAVATVAVAGAELSLTGQAEGTTTVAVTASDPDGLSVAQEISVNVVRGETSRFRADFDEERLLASEWLLQDASASIADGILRLEVTVPGGLGLATVLLQAPITEVEATTRVAFGDTESTALVLLLWTSNPPATVMALDIGSGVQVNGRDTNYRFRVLDESGGEKGGVFRHVRGASGVSEAVPAVEGEFVDLGFSVKNGRLRAWIGDAELFDIEWPFSFSPVAQALSVGAYPPEEYGTGGIGLFDWVEVTGRAKGAGSRATEPDRRLELPRWTGGK